MAADRLFVICLNKNGHTHHSLSLDSDNNVHISKSSPLFQNKCCTNVKRKVNCSG